MKLTTLLAGLAALGVALAGFLYWSPWEVTVKHATKAVTSAIAEKIADKPRPALDKNDYDLRMRRLAHVGESSTTTSTATGTQSLWPVKDAPYPLPGALLPFNRIVAYYGNFYSKSMGVLGEYPDDVMLAKLKAEEDKWAAADPSTPVLPAIHYIATTAQGAPGKDGTYMIRMPDDQIDHAIELAKKVNGVVFLDLQVGHSNVRTEVPLLEKYLLMPQVHLGIDPEFYMHNGQVPGSYIGTMDAADVNWAADYLAKLVKEHDLPPKVLLIHRFTEGMVTHSSAIKPLPEVQIVMDMDGWGEPAKKIGTYQSVVTPEPVQFSGFKLFYKNDLRAPSTRMLAPREILGLTPSPIYIQYQ